jgi:hypothetical protein
VPKVEKNYIPCEMQARVDIEGNTTNIAELLDGVIM